MQGAVAAAQSLQKEKKKNPPKEFLHNKRDCLATQNTQKNVILATHIVHFLYRDIGARGQADVLGLCIDDHENLGGGGR